MIKIKSGVKPPIVVMLAAVANVAQDLSHEVWITSGNDSKHMQGSKHYENAAIDIRSKNFPSAQTKRDFMAAVLKRLGSSYQMILESEGKTNEHFHLEFDPN